MDILRNRRRPAAGRRAGLSLIEVVVGASILVLLTRSLLESSQSMGRLTAGNNVRALLAQQAQEGLNALVHDLRRTGIREVDGVEFPHVFEGGVADPALAAHDHLPAVQTADVDDPDFGVQHSIVFLRAADVDHDGRPDMDGNLNGTPELDGDGDGVRSESFGDLDGWDASAFSIDPENGLVWSHDQVRFAVVTGMDGVNYLERRIDGDPDTAHRIARDVELMTIETSADTGYQIPTNALRIRLCFRKRDPEGTLFRHQAEVVVALRNGGIEFQ